MMEVYEVAKERYGSGAEECALNEIRKEIRKELQDQMVGEFQGELRKKFDQEFTEDLRAVLKKEVENEHYAFLDKMRSSRS